MMARVVKTILSAFFYDRYISALKKSSRLYCEHGSLSVMYQFAMVYYHVAKIYHDISIAFLYLL